MAKIQYLTQKKLFNKTKPSVKKIKTNDSNTVVCFSTTNLIAQRQRRNKKISKNVKTALRKLSKSDKENNKRLMSALNIMSEKEIVCSAMNIPSIENMLTSSKKDLISPQNSEDGIQSGVSFKESISYIVIESEPDLMITYMCLVQKAIQKLGFSLSNKQNEKLMKAVWNLAVKYWSDDLEQNQYPSISAKIQWGLLQLLNFDLNVGKKDRVIMEDKIKSLNEIIN